MDFILKSKIVKNLLIFQLEFSSDIDISLIQKFYSSYGQSEMPLLFGLCERTILNL